MNILDFRSDTLTRPTPEMRAAMAAAEVGDDVLDRDPTLDRAWNAASPTCWGRRRAFGFPPDAWRT